MGLSSNKVWLSVLAALILIPLIFFSWTLRRFSGICENTATGAAIIDDARIIYVKGKDAWSPDFLGKKAQVLGLVFSRTDQSVFVAVTGEPTRHGKPAASEVEAENARRMTTIIPWSIILKP